MNSYDFDKTIYNGDSTVNFFKFCIRKKPSVLLTVPRTGVYFLKYKLGKCTKTDFKQAFYRFLRRLKSTEDYVALFWSKSESGIKGWYRDRLSHDDIIISASPEFLLRPICDRLGIELIASRVDPHTGAYSGVNCDGEEKVRRLHEKFPGAHIESFYSDSLSDSPMAAIADKAFMVRGDKITDWPAH